LNDVMVGYDQAVAERAQEPTDEETAQQKFDQLREAVIRPLMRAFGEVLEAHGHHCRVYDKPISVTTPGNLTQYAEIIMHILPKEGAVPPVTRNGYQLSFLLAQEHRKLLARMTHGRWEESCSSCPHDLHPLEGVTAELIEAELLEMMQHVFADARPPSAVDIGRAPWPAAEREKRSYLASATSAPLISVVVCQHPQRRHQDTLRLLDAHWPSAPALPHRPLADRALKTDDVPDATASGTAEAAERVERCADTTASVNLRVGEITTAIAAAGQSHHRHATDDVEAGDGELRLEVPCRVVHLASDRASAQHDAERVDGAVVDDRPSVRISLVHRLKDVIVSPDHRQAGDRTSRGGFPFALGHHAASRRP
jgi:hypothetical protein